MKKYIIRFLLGVVMLTGIASCKKNNVVIDQDPLIAPEAARILKTTLQDNFYILSTSSGGSTYKIPIGVTTVSNTERKIQLVYTARAAANGTQYTAPTTLTIPAGKAVDTLTIQGLFAGYTIPGRKDTLKIKLVSGDGFIKPNAYSDSMILIMQKYCNVVPAEMQGDFNNTREYNSGGALTWGPYWTGVKDWTAVNATSATVKIENIYDFGWNDIEATLDWTEAANFKVSITKQNTGMTDGGFPVYVRSSSGRTNTFSSCDQTITLTIDLLGGADGTEVLEANYQVRIVR